MPDKRGAQMEDQLKYRRLADIDGVTFAMDVHFRKKQKGKTERTTKYTAKKSNFGKSGIEKTQADIEQFIDECLVWDSIYFEVSDDNDDKITALYDKKKLALMLARDEFLEWRTTLQNYDPLLLDYL